MTSAKTDTVHTGRVDYVVISDARGMGEFDRIRWSTPHRTTAMSIARNEEMRGRIVRAQRVMTETTITTEELEIEK